MPIDATLPALPVGRLIQKIIIAVPLLDLPRDHAENIDHQKGPQGGEGADRGKLLDRETTAVPPNVAKYEEGKRELSHDAAGLRPPRCLEILQEGVE